MLIQRYADFILPSSAASIASSAASPSIVVRVRNSARFSSAVVAAGRVRAHLLVVGDQQALQGGFLDLASLLRE